MKVKNEQEKVTEKKFPRNRKQLNKSVGGTWVCRFSPPHRVADVERNYPDAIVTWKTLKTKIAETDTGRRNV